MWTNGTDFYMGECRIGDRAATAEEIAAYNLQFTKTLRKTEILSELKDIDQKTIRPMSEGENEKVSDMRPV